MNLAGQRVAVTGARGRLGSAVLATLSGRNGVVVLPWSRPDYDLDAPDPRGLFERDRPSLVIHSAAWTDVDGCAREPDRAKRRNTDATGVLAEACVAAGVPLLVVSTNEVFPGDREEGLGYVETDLTGPRNPYGTSKLAAEQAAQRAFGPGDSGLWIVRTAWLYGPPGPDFPTKIVAAADRLAAGEALPVVTDERGSPTSTTDLADAMVGLLGVSDGGTFHLVNGGTVSRYDWARRVLSRCRPDRPLRTISRDDYVRPSQPPAWAVLNTDRARAAGIQMRDWTEPLDDYLDEIC